MKSTKDYPDEVINFMRNHPTMYNAVYPVHKRPLVVRTNVDYEFTTITVDQVAAADGNYEVLFLGTGKFSISWSIYIDCAINVQIKSYFLVLIEDPQLLHCFSLMMFLAKPFSQAQLGVQRRYKGVLYPRCLLLSNQTHPKSFLQSFIARRKAFVAFL